VYVASFSEQDVLDTLQIRIALEGLATQRLSNIPDDLIEGMRDNLRIFRQTIKARDFVANNEIDRSFHLLIIEAARSRQLSRVYQNLHSHMIIERLMYENEKKALEELQITDKEHWRIVQAFERKDKKEIRKTVRSHLNNVKRRIAKTMEAKEDN